MDIEGALGLRSKLNLTYVPRWTIVPMMRHQSVAEHSFRVALIAQDLGWRINRPSLSLSAAICALSHDAEESVTGDIPSTAKPPTPFPEDAVGILVKLADLLEAAGWVRMWGHGPRIEVIAERIDSQVESLIQWAVGTDVFNDIDLRNAVEAVNNQLEGV